MPTLTGYDPGVHLSITDEAIDSREAPSMVSLRIKASKTDLFRAGVTVHLGRTDRDLCPVAALLSFIEGRGLQPGPLFIRRNGRPLTRQVLVSSIRDALSSVGINPAPYSGHNLRIGAATSAAAARNRRRGHQDLGQMVQLRVSGIRAHPTQRPLGSVAQNGGVKVFVYTYRS